MANVDKELIYKTINNFKNMSISVVGDLILDVYKDFNSIEKLEQGAPVFNCKDKTTNMYLGGAGNVLQNFVSLGVCDNSMYSIVGVDRGGFIIGDIIHDMPVHNFIIGCEDKVTSVKTRISCNGEQIMRLDNENSNDIPYKAYKDLIEDLGYNNSNVIVISDYNKGVVNQDVMNYINCENTFVALDPAKRNVDDYSNIDQIDLIKLNYSEALYLTDSTEFDYDKTNENDLYDLAYKFYEIFGCTYVTITLDVNGMYYWQKPNEYDPIYGIIKSYAKTVDNSVGAGDTVIAALSLALASGLDVVHSHMIANKAAAIAIEKKDTSSVTVDELLN